MILVFFSNASAFGFWFPMCKTVVGAGGAFATGMGAPTTALAGFNGLVALARFR